MAIRSLLSCTLGRYILASFAATGIAVFVWAPRDVSAATGDRSTVRVRTTSAKIVKPSEPHSSTAARNPLSGFRLRLKNGKMNMHMVGNQPVVTGMSGQIGNGNVKINSHVDMGRPEGPQRARVELKDVDLGEVLRLAHISFKGQLAGNASGVLDLKWDGMEFDAARQSVHGTVDLKLGPGRLSDFSGLAVLAKKFGISDLDDLDFTRGHVRGKVESGEFRVTSVELDGPLFHLGATGEISLNGSAMDVALTSRVAEEVAKKSNLYQLRNVASFFGRDAVKVTNGFVDLPEVTIRGSARKPEFALASADKPVQPAPQVGTKPANSGLLSMFTGGGRE